MRPNTEACRQVVGGTITSARGESPLDYMLRVMRDPNVDPHRRDYMAKAAAAYVHPRLNSTEVGGKVGSPVIIEITPDEAKY